MRFRTSVREGAYNPLTLLYDWGFAFRGRHVNQNGSTSQSPPVRLDEEQ